MALTPGLLARGRWELDQVEARWSDVPFEAPGAATRAADEAIDALRERGSPAHDGLSARLVSFEAHPDRLALALEPVRWALGAGGAVDAGENPARTLVRELREEWSVTPERLTVEALVCLPQRLVMLVGMAWLAPGAVVVPDAEHDAFAWWPAEIDQWPAEADAPLRAMAAMLSAA